MKAAAALLLLCALFACPAAATAVAPVPAFEHVVLIVFENRWAAPFARAVRKAGGQLVAFDRIPVQALLASLEAAEARS